MKKTLSMLIVAALLLSFLHSTASAPAMTDHYVSDTTDLWWSEATTTNIDGSGYIAPPNDALWNPVVFCWKHSSWNASLKPADLKARLFASPSADWIWKSYQVTYEESLAGDIVFFEKQIHIPKRAYSITADLLITADNAYYFYVNNPSWSGTPNGIAKFATGYNSTNFYYEEIDGKLRPLDIAIPSQTTSWNYIEAWSISTLLHVGENWLQIVAINEHSPPSGATNNPAGLIYKLVISYEMPIEVDIDIKPGSFPNSICLSAQGNLPVAILGSEDFNVTAIDPATIMIGGATLTTRGSVKKPKLAYSFEDVNEDGYTDLITFFDLQELIDTGVLTENTTALAVDGYLYPEQGGTPITGTDSIRVVPPPHAHLLTRSSGQE